MSESPLTNGHDKTDKTDKTSLEAIEIPDGAVVLQEQLRAVQIGAARHAERQTIEVLIRDAQARYIRARQANNYQTEVEAVREVLRLLIYLSKRGFE
jgi:hypothetical protein